MATARMPQPIADDPVKVDPKHYKVEFENDRVTRAACSGADDRLRKPLSRRTGCTLSGEDDLSIELIRTFDEQQRKVAIVEPTAYKDILTAASRKAALNGQPSGLSASKMNTTQFDALMALMEEYARNVPDELADRRLAQINKAARNIYFAWSGGINPSDPRYYRVQTPSFLIEFDDTQGNANHIHSVWRDFKGDFGEDLLQQHYSASHNKEISGHHG